MKLRDAAALASVGWYLIIPLTGWEARGLSVSPEF